MDSAERYPFTAPNSPLKYVLRTRCAEYAKSTHGMLKHILLPIHWRSLRVPGRIDFVSMPHAQYRHFIEWFPNDL